MFTPTRAYASPHSIYRTLLDLCETINNQSWLLHEPAYASPHPIYRALLDLCLGLSLAFA
jgi:hypothetical protein